MILKNRYKLRMYCKNFQYIENYEEAVKSTELYDLHHRKEIETLEDGTTILRSRKELIDMDLYWHRSPEELIFLKRSEHIRLHCTNLSYETIEKRSVSLKGKYTGDRSPTWKGDQISYKGMRSRLWRQKKREALANSLT